MSISPPTLSYLETRGIEANAVIKEMEEIFPPVNPSPADDIKAIMYKAGQRSVVEWLIKRMEND